MNRKRIIILAIISLSCTSIFSQNKDAHFTIENIDTFPIRRLGAMDMYDMFFYNIFDTLTEPCKHNEAVYVFEYRLEQLKKAIINRKKTPMYVTSIIENFVYVTGIASEAPGTPYGQFRPTANDVKRWQKWLDENKHKLCWYEKENVLYVKFENQ